MSTDSNYQNQQFDEWFESEHSTKNEELEYDDEETGEFEYKV